LTGSIQFARVLTYLCVVILQFAAPILLSVFLGLLLKTLGHYTLLEEINWLELMAKPKAEFTWKTLRLIFNPIVFRGLLNYMTWWVTFSSFLSSLFGLVYHSNFTT
jgi:hypothetical protein